MVLFSGRLHGCDLVEKKSLEGPYAQKDGNQHKAESQEKKKNGALILLNY